MISFPLLLELGIVLLFSYLLAQIMNKYHMPLVLGFLLSGVAINVLVLIIYPGKEFWFLNYLKEITDITLGFIGIEVGAELEFRKLKGKLQNMFILAWSQALGAFIIVTLLVWAWTGELYLGMVFGTFATATAPAATVQVLKEEKVKGELRESTMFILFVDDIIALVLAAFVIPYGETILGGQASILHSLYLGIKEILLSILIGVISGFFLLKVIRWLPKELEKVDLVVIIVLIDVGLATLLEASSILSLMIVGMITVNFCCENYEVINATETLSMPLVLVFFTLIGLSANLNAIQSLGFIVGLYIIGTFIGKYIGAFTGATLTHISPNIRKYLGFALLNQAGVALGIASLAFERFSKINTQGETVGLMIITTLTVTTIILQVIGPLGIKYAAIKTKTSEIAIQTGSFLDKHSYRKPLQ